MGNLYIVDFGGEIFQVVSVPLPNALWAGGLLMAILLVLRKHRQGAVGFDKRFTRRRSM